MNSPPDEVVLTSDGYEKGPGERLREARLMTKLSLEEVSARLHLDRRTLESLEADDFAKLPAPTFVRGYLRSYARLLELPPAPVIEAFDRRGFAPPPLIADIATQGETRSTDLWVVAFTITIAVVLVILAAVWFQTQRDDDLTVMETGPGFSLSQPPAAPTASPAPPTGYETTPRPGATGPIASDGAPPSANVTVPTPAGSSPLPAPGSEPGSSAGVDPTVGLPPVVASEVTPAGTPTAVGPETAPSATGGTGTPPPLSATSPPGSASGAGISPAPAAQSAARPSTPSADPAATPTAARSGSAPTETAGGLDRVSVTLTHDAWVEIHDAEGARLHYNLARAGQRIEVQGAPPIRVLLGYVDGVKVEYNGTPFDFSPFVSRGMARFELRP